MCPWMREIPHTSAKQNEEEYAESTFWTDGMSPMSPEREAFVPKPIPPTTLSEEPLRRQSVAPEVRNATRQAADQLQVLPRMRDLSHVLDVGVVSNNNETGMRKTVSTQDYAWYREVASGPPALGCYKTAGHRTTASLRGAPGIPVRPLDTNFSSGLATMQTAGCAASAVEHQTRFRQAASSDTATFSF